ncbi:hypothetical protein BJX76DRAFT_327314 [Aspergillus varians]
MATDYAKKTNAELVEILKSRNLPHGGKKADMVSRLQEDDSAKPAAPAQADTADDVIDWEDDDVTAADSTAAANPAEETAAPAPAVSAAPQTEETKTTDEAAQVAEAGQEGAEPAAGTTEEAAAAAPQQEPAEEKPAPNFSIGLSVTDLEEELKKRRARAEKFGITEDSQAAIDAAEKKLERAKRFGTAGEEAPDTEIVSRLDQALPEGSRKRGRAETEQGGRGGKRRNPNGRNNNTNNNNSSSNQRQRGRGAGGGNRNQGQNRNQTQGQGPKRNTNTAAANGLSAKDKEALEARKKRFATGA